jgi:hypothetical protein
MMPGIATGFSGPRLSNIPAKMLGAVPGSGDNLPTLIADLPVNRIRAWFGAAAPDEQFRSEGRIYPGRG